LPDYSTEISALVNIWVVMDVSNSMNESYIELAFKDLVSLIRQYSFVSIDISFMSTTITKPFNIKNEKSLKDAVKKVKTTGGTDYDSIFEYYKTQRLDKMDLILVYSDGDDEIKNSKNIPKIPILWALTKDTKAKLQGVTINI
jgi:predicted metal-dependent peptidase